MSDNILPFDFGEVISTELTRANRDNDHLAHASSHIKGSLRHAALDVAGAPKKPRSIIDQITLQTGTMWHEYIATTMSRLGIPIMQEINVTPWLPTGWAGTLDGLAWSPKDKGFVLLDYKTCRGSALKWIARDGAKVEHQAQASAYWYAVEKMGLPLVKKIAVIYVPKDPAGKDLTEPLQVTFAPLPKKELHADMANRWGTISGYVTSLGGTPGQPVEVKTLQGWVTDSLPPVQAREQKLYLDRATGMSEVRLVPNWSTAYCQFEDDLCNCSDQGQTKIGVYDTDGTYLPRAGYEATEPTVTPYDITPY